MGTRRFSTSRNSISSNKKWLSLIEVIISVFIEMLILYAFANVAMTVNNDFGYVKGKVDNLEHIESFKSDMGSLRRGYPETAYSTGSSLAYSRVGFNLSVFSHVSGSGGVVIGVARKTSSGSEVVTGVPQTYADYVPFFLPIDSAMLSLVRTNNYLDTSALDLSHAYFYPALHTLKFNVSKINGSTERIDLVTLDSYYAAYEGKDLIRLWSDPDVSIFLNSFLE